MDPILYSNYRELTAAIILQACRDYIRARRYLAKHDLRKIERDVNKAWARYVLAIDMGYCEEELAPIRTAYFTRKKQWTRYCDMRWTVDSIENDFENSAIKRYLTLLGVDVSSETIVRSLIAKGDRISTVIDGFTYKK